MILFPETHVDLLQDKTYSAAQLAKHWARELLRKYSQHAQNDLRDFMQIASTVDPETFPNYIENEDLLRAFVADKTVCYMRRLADEVKNDLLIATLAFEKAGRDVVSIGLSIDGRQATEEILEEIDEETLEVLQIYVPAVSEIDPIPETILALDDDGIEQEIPNPAKHDPETGAVAMKNAALAILNGASSDVRDLSATRLPPSL